LHNASFGGIAIHNKGVILDCNQGLSNITGFSQNELLGMDGLLLICDDTRQKVIDNIESGFEKPYEVIGLRKDGTRYPLRLVGKNIPYKGEQVRVVEFRDITEQKETEIELIRAKEKAEESDRLKSAFLANMSHEIRTPMNGILGFTDLLRIQDLSSDKRDSYIEIIHRSGQRLLDTVNDIVEISKIEAGLVVVNKSEFNINNEIEELIKFFRPQAEEKGLILIFEKPVIKYNAIVNTDIRKFESILTNLIKNAIKFTDEGIICVGASVNANKIDCYVKDTGIGIPHDRLEAVFNRFEQADIKDLRAKQGSGLGLAISKAYIEILGGKIMLQSQENEGSEFRFTIPNLKVNDVSQVETGVDVAITVANSQKSKKLRILVAEDDDISYLYLETIMAEVNCDLVRCTNGAETVKEFDSCKDFDMIIMDVKMPIMNGLDATREIRKKDKKIKIIANSAYAMPGDKEAAIEAGCNGYLTKPLRKEDILFSIGIYKENVHH
jgi:PAS domain S-box-containing protein